MGWTQRQARPAEPPTSRSEALASCTSHRGIGSIAASPLTSLASPGLILAGGTAWRAPSDYNINHITIARSSAATTARFGICWLSIGAQ